MLSTAIRSAPSAACSASIARSMRPRPSAGRAGPICRGDRRAGVRTRPGWKFYDEAEVESQRAADGSRSARQPPGDAGNCARSKAACWCKKPTLRPIRSRMERRHNHAKPTDATIGRSAIRLGHCAARQIERDRAGQDRMLVGVGAGQMSRVDSTRSRPKSRRPRGRVRAGLRAFFPFADSIELAAAAGIRAVIQPGGSKPRRRSRSPPATSTALR